MTPRIWRILAVAGGALLLLGLWGIHAGGHSAGRLEARLQAAAEAALAGREHGWASVSVSGQVATVSGQAPSESARLDALAAVSAAEWAGGRFAGGITRVEDDTTPNAIHSDFGLRAAAQNGRISVVGEVASETIRASLSEFATRLFPAGADISLAVNPDATADAAAEESARRLMTELARLDRGQIAVRSNRGVLYGTASNGQTAGSAVRGATELPAPFIGAAYVDHDRGDPLSLIPDRLACDVLIFAAIQPAELRFDPALETLRAQSRADLTALGAMLDSCPETRLVITAGLEGNVPLDPQRLAEARAEAVRDALLEGGARPEQIVTRIGDADSPRIRFETAPLEGG